MAKQLTYTSGGAQIAGPLQTICQPIDFRYGPWHDVEQATRHIANPYSNKTFYGLTIGVFKYDEEDPTEIIGVDEYWWQPRGVWDADHSEWIDGFVMKYPANTPVTVPDREDYPGKVLGLSDDEHSYGATWRDDNAEQEWNELGNGRDHSEIIETEEP